jgi:hypothetical protein
MAAVRVPASVHRWALSAQRELEQGISTAATRDGDGRRVRGLSHRQEAPLVKTEP